MEAPPGELLGGASTVRNEHHNACVQIDILQRMAAALAPPGRRRFLGVVAAKLAERSELMGDVWAGSWCGETPVFVRGGAR